MIRYYVGELIFNITIPVARKDCLTDGNRNDKVINNGNKKLYRGNILQSQSTTVHGYTVTFIPFGR